MQQRRRGRPARYFGALSWLPRGLVAALALAIPTLIAPAALVQDARAQDARTQEARIFRIGTAGTAGTYFQIGGAIAGAISSPPGTPECTRPGQCGVPGLVAVAQATQGSIENVQLLGQGQIESAFVQADVAYWAYSGSNMFAKRGATANLRAIGALFPEALHIVVRQDSPIRGLRDLKGRRVVLGERESGTLADALLVLEAAGLREKDISAYYLRLPQASAELGASTIDALFQVGAYPVPGIAELAGNMQVRLLPISSENIDRLRQKHRFFAATSIPADTYPANDQDTPTVAVRALWVTTSDAPEALIHAITRALWQDSTRRAVEARHPAGARVSLDHALDGVGIPLHPGAERYYREAGLSIDTPKP